MRVRTLGGVLLAAGLSWCCSIASGGVIGTVWIEVDNRVGTVGDAAGMETGLEGIRTFDLFAMVTPDTSLWLADFGFASTYSEHRSMWTNRQVYQNPFGGDVRSKSSGLLRTPEFAALEFDTYLAFGGEIAEFTEGITVNGADWSPDRFRAIWSVKLPTNTGVAITPATGAL